jgi:SAM-dependent methyltransferase
VHKSAQAHMSHAISDYMNTYDTYTVVDVGSRIVGDQSTSHRPLFAGYKMNYVGLDVAAGQNVDIVLEQPYVFPVADDSADIVISGQVFEHVPFFWATFLEMARVLKPNGLIFLTAPSRGHIHSPPFDCWRFYPDGYRSLGAFASLEVLRCYTDFPPKKAESRQFDYAKVPASQYWGDTVGVFRKGAGYQKAEIAKVAAVLLPWVNRQSDIDGLAPKVKRPDYIPL